MTRQGLCYPRAFYGTFRRAAERLHGRPLSEWLVDRFASTKGHPASEFEALGAFAYYRGGRDQFAWPAVTQNAASSFPALQKLSWGGLDTTLRLVLECVIAGASTPGELRTGRGLGRVASIHVARNRDVSVQILRPVSNPAAPRRGPRAVRRSASRAPAPRRA